jgi:hypothetical protein
LFAAYSGDTPLCSLYFGNHKNPAKKQETESLMPETPYGKRDTQQDEEDGNDVGPDQRRSPQEPDPDEDHEDPDNEHDPVHSLQPARMSGF